MISALHQFVGGYQGNDAVSNQVRAMRDIFRGWGLRSDIYCDSRRIQPQMRSEVRDISAWPAEPAAGDAVLLHLSTGSVVNRVFGELRCPRAIMYHNITPALFFESVQRHVAHCVATGRKEAAALAGKSDVTMAASRYNADELVAMGFKDVRVMPLLFDVQGLPAKPSRKILKLFKDGLTNVLFVGRGAPNKKLEDLLLAFSAFQKAVQPASRLIIAGSVGGFERYHFILRAMCRDLSLKNVVFTGSVDRTELSTLYQCSHLFLCMSEHEGFCLPLLESMYHRLPVLAYAAAAIPETLAGSGVLFREKDFQHVSEMMGRLTSDRSFADAVIEKQIRRVNDYLRKDLASELRGHLAPILG